MKHRIGSTVICAFIALAFILGCTAKNPTLTLTFNDAGDQCTYDGPKSFTYGTFTLKVVRGEKYTGSIGFAIATLDEGQTFDDLNAYTSVEPPNWVQVITAQGPLSQDKSYSYDLTTRAIYKLDKPLYFVCFSGVDENNPVKVGTIGPINIKE